MLEAKRRTHLLSDGTPRFFMASRLPYLLVPKYLALYTFCEVAFACVNSKR